jgi:hypothetical protein
MRCRCEPCRQLRLDGLRIQCAYPQLHHADLAKSNFARCVARGMGGFVHRRIEAGSLEKAEV